MQPAIPDKTPKKATNLSVNSELLSEAKKLKINLSATFERALLREVRKNKQQRWLEDNEKAIGACNELVETSGLFATKHSVL